MSGRAVPDIAGISGTRRVFTFPLVNSSPGIAARLVSKHEKLRLLLLFQLLCRD